MKAWVLSLVVVCVAGSSGCNKQDKEIFSSVGRKVAVRLEDATGPARKKVEASLKSLRGGILEGSLEEAVQFRFHTDKELHQEVIEVVNKGEGAILLKGELTDIGMKGRAIALAQTTRGVEKVEEEFSEKKSVEKKEEVKKKEDVPEEKTKKEPLLEEKGGKEPAPLEKKSPVQEPFKPFDPVKEKGAQDKPAPLLDPLGR